MCHQPGGRAPSLLFPLSLWILQGRVPTFSPVHSESPAVLPMVQPSGHPIPGRNTADLFCHTSHGREMWPFSVSLPPRWRSHPVVKSYQGGRWGNSCEETDALAASGCWTSCAKRCPGCSVHECVLRGWEGACTLTNKSPGDCVPSAECNWTIIGLDP